MDPERVHMAIGPLKRDLQNIVELGEGVIGWDAQKASDARVGAAEEADDEEIVFGRSWWLRKASLGINQLRRSGE